MTGVLVVAMALMVSPCLAVDEADLIEFDKLPDAQAFGWGALPGAVLTTSQPGKIGEYALRVDPSPEPKEYMGIELSHNFDLTRAGAADKLVFFVKQNFGIDICINLRTARGNVYRYIPVTREEWSRVEVDLDLAHWDRPEGLVLETWPKVSYLHIYSRGFDTAGEYMLVDGFSFFVGGKPVVTIPQTAPAKE